jgi:hypothetical protein
MQRAEALLEIIGRRHWRAGCSYKLHARFGGGLPEKDPTAGTSPAAYPAGTGDQDGRPGRAA